jgi:hypothetical protein
MDTPTVTIHTVSQNSFGKDIIMTNASGSDGSSRPEDTRTPLPNPKTPRWVKAFLIAAALLVVIFAVIHLSGGATMNHTP